MRANTEPKIVEIGEEPATVTGSQGEHLVIISVPFYRIARVSLSECVLGYLRQSSDVLVVAPFADEPGFRRTFGGGRTRFHRWRSRDAGKFLTVIFGMSEVLRMNGYWWRFRHDGMEYYLRNQATSFSAGENDGRGGALKRVLVRILSLLGRYPRAWRILDRLIGGSVFLCDELNAITKRYPRVTLIQSASWGFQDRALAWLAEKGKWRKVMLPYATDQLLVNGYLLCKFDAICVQGSCEEKAARSFHSVPEERIFRLGSAWFRHLDLVRGRVAKSRTQGPISHQKKIMYAGVAAEYFPRKSEFVALDLLIERVRSGRFGAYDIIYRPVEKSEAGRRQIVARYGEQAGVTVQWPGHSSVGLDGYEDIDHASELEQYVHELSQCSLLIMSLTTSLSRDAVYVANCGVIANMYDPTGILARRHTSLLSLSEFPGITCVRTEEELTAALERALARPEEVRREAARSIEPWDYPHADFTATLAKAVFG